jgi:hypothetical protein
MVERAWRGGDVALERVTRQPTWVGGSYFSAKGICSCLFYHPVQVSFNCRSYQAPAAMCPVSGSGGTSLCAGPQCADLAL